MRLPLTFRVITMGEVEFAKVSSKGQVVIPQAIRERLGIEEGTAFAVWSRGDEILLKKMSVPSEVTWEEATAPFRAIARQRRITIDDINIAIQRVRSMKR